MPASQGGVRTTQPPSCSPPPGHLRGRRLPQLLLRHGPWAASPLPSAAEPTRDQGSTRSRARSTAIVGVLRGRRLRSIGRSAHHQRQIRMLQRDRVGPERPRRLSNCRCRCRRTPRRCRVRPVRRVSPRPASVRVSADPCILRGSVPLRASRPGLQEGHLFPPSQHLLGDPLLLGGPIRGAHVQHIRADDPRHVQVGLH